VIRAGIEKHACWAVPSVRSTAGIDRAASPFNSKDQP
jgi:hypothetical protein